MIRVDYSKCTKCGRCAKLCAVGAITLSSGGAEISDKCILCGSCVRGCPAHAIEIDAVLNQQTENSDDYRGVAVIAEFDETSQVPLKVTLELLSKGRELADRLGEELYAVALCERMSADACRVFERIGCERVILFEGEYYRDYNGEIFTDQITEVILREKPSCVLVPATENGRDLAPAIAARLHTGLTADCTGLEINDDGELIQIRPTYGGNIIASIRTPNHRPQMATVRSNIFPVVECGEKYKMKIIRPEMVIPKAQLRVALLSSTEKETVYPDVQDAELLLIGGYGVSQESFALLYRIADRLGGAVGATRKAVDEGWAPFEIQIGQTGKAVSPELAICFGVSGALQHTIGIRETKKIIAVNNDPNAAIFNMADTAILADCEEIIREMARQLCIL